MLDATSSGAPPWASLVTKDNLADLMYVACNNRASEREALQLLAHDEQGLRFLQGTDAGQQDLVYKLLQASLVRKHYNVPQHLLKLPAAALLGESLALLVAGNFRCEVHELGEYERCALITTARAYDMLAENLQRNAMSLCVCAWELLLCV